VLQRVVAVGSALRPIGQPEMSVRCPLEVTTADRKGLASLERAQTLEAVVVALSHDHRLLG